jgi:hypothetical protein
MATEARAIIGNVRHKAGSMDALFGLLAIIAAVPVLGILKLFRVKHNFELMETAGFIVVIVPVAGVYVLLVCRFFGLWPFSSS